MINSAQFADFSFNTALPHRAQNVGRALNQVNMKKPHHAAWGAFQAGMYFLQQYAGRSPGNSETIAKANLQLLHRSLLKDSSYVQSIKAAQVRMAGNDRPSSSCIFNENGLRADLLSLNTGTTIQLKTTQNSCAMYLAIVGKPSILPANGVLPPSKRWWLGNHREDTGRTLKNEDTVIVSPRNKVKQQLSAEKKQCMLLRIQLPNRRDQESF